MRWYHTLLLVILGSSPLLVQAQVSQRQTPAEDATQTRQIERPPVRKSLMGMVMGALIESAEQQQRSKTAARAQTLPPDDTTLARRAEPPQTDDTPARTAVPEQIALQSDDTPQ